MNKTIYLSCSVFIVTLLKGGGLWAAQPNLQITEAMVAVGVYQNTPQAQQLEGQAEQADVNLQQLNQAYEVSSYLSHQYSDSKEEALAVFAPTFGPVQSSEVGLKQQLPYGVQWTAGLFSTQTSTTDLSINKATRSGWRVQLNVDLLKNFLGRQANSQRLSLKAQKDKALIEKNLKSKELEMEARKLYWSLYANHQAIELSKRLITQAEKQLKDAKKRARSQVADRGDVSRVQALLSSRKTSLAKFEYEKELLSLELKKIFPAWGNYSLSVSSQTPTKKLAQCIARMSSYAVADLSLSDYTKMIEILKKQYALEQKQARTQGDWDLQLVSELQTSVVESSYQDSVDQLGSDGEQGYSLGLQLTVPLGGVSSRLEKKQILANQKLYESQIRQLETQIKEKHRQVVLSLALLRKAVHTSRDNVKHLSTSLQSMKKKYRQARIPLTQLITEQEVLFNNQLQDIQTKLLVVHAIYDYFKIFNDFPCEINQVAQVKK